MFSPEGFSLKELFNFYEIGCDGWAGEEFEITKILARPVDGGVLFASGDKEYISRLNGNFFAFDDLDRPGR